MAYVHHCHLGPNRSRIDCCAQGSMGLPYLQIATEEGLFVQEGRDLIQGRSQVEGAISIVSTEPAPAAEQRHTQAPPWCSDCHII